MKRIVVLLAVLSACAGDSPGPARDVFTTSDAEDLCVRSIVEWRARDEGDDAYTTTAEGDARAVCDTMLAKENRD